MYQEANLDKETTKEVKEKLHSFPIDSQDSLEEALASLSKMEAKNKDKEMGSEVIKDSNSLLLLVVMVLQVKVMVTTILKPVRIKGDKTTEDKTRESKTQMGRIREKIIKEDRVHKGRLR